MFPNRLREEIHEEICRFDPNRSVEDAVTPPFSWYTDPRFLELEKETVFKNDWLFAGHTSQLTQAGDYVTDNFLGWPYLLTRNQDDRLRGFYNVCSHHGARVAEGSGRTDCFVCPYHGWQYRLDGSLKKAPRAGSIKAHTLNRLALNEIPTTERSGFVWLCFGKSAPSPATAFVELDRELAAFNTTNLHFVERVVFRVACNWKVFIDNYLDGGYHVPHLHRNLNRKLIFDTYTSAIHKRCVVQTCMGSAAGTDEGTPRFEQKVLYLWLYPNFMINRYGKWMDTNWVIPIDHRQCLVVFDFYHEGEPNEGERVASVNASSLVQEEDRKICEMVQEGLASGAYRQGIYSQNFEEPMLHWHRLLHRDYGQL